jgi:hypothetical protein
MTSLLSEQCRAMLERGVLVFIVGVAISVMSIPLDASRSIL